MEYEGEVYRPPSEARSLIVQVTIGCSHNGCSFCTMYKGKQFRCRSFQDILMSLRAYRSLHTRVERIFLADGDALIIETSTLIRILKAIKTIFPECQRVSSYATPRDLLSKSLQDLISLKTHGLSMVYMGIESGCDRVLKAINKGVTSQDISLAGQRAVQAGMVLSVTLISGLGGRKNTRSHALESARLVSEIKPAYLGLLTLMVDEGTPMAYDIESGQVELLSPREVLEETYMFLEHLRVEDCIFRSNHASNYVALAGHLQADQGRLLMEIKTHLNKAYDYKDEAFRGL